MIAMLAGPPREIVSNTLAMHTCETIGFGTNREPELVTAVSRNARVLLTALIIYNVGIDRQVTRFEMHTAYINFMTEIGMSLLAEDMDSSKTERIIEELHSACIVSGGHSTFGGLRFATLYNTDPHKAIMRVVITPVNVLRCPDLETILAKRLRAHFEAIKAKNG